MTTADTGRLPLVLIGAGGHAKVLHALALEAGHIIAGVCDPQLAQQGLTHWRGIPVLGDDDALNQFDSDAIGLINGVGQLVGSKARQNIFTRLSQAGFNFPVMAHPSAWVAPTATLAQGVQVMAGVVLQPDCCIGANTIINTRASVDHDCVVGANVHIGPGATLCGGVHVHEFAFIGSGATVIQGLLIGSTAVVGAGVTVTRDLGPDQMLLGPTPRLKLSPLL